MKKTQLLLTILLFMGCGGASDDVNEAIVKVDPGKNGGSCYENMTCDTGLFCNNNQKCEIIKEGTPDGLCFGNGTCMENYLCDQEKGICVDPCKDHDCGDNATCVLKNDLPFCQCSIGYAGDQCDQCDTGYVAYDSYCSLPPQSLWEIPRKDSLIGQDSEGNFIRESEEKLIKENSEGTLIWEITPLSEDDFIQDRLTYYLMKNDHIVLVISGYFKGDSRLRRFVVEYDQNGVQLSRTETTESPYKYQSFTTPFDGHFYSIVHEKINGDAGGYKYYLRKFNFDQTDVWLKEVNIDMEAGQYEISEMALDQNGDMITKIYSEEKPGLDPTMIAKFSLNGNFLWSKRVGRFGLAYCTDGNNNIYVAAGRGSVENRILVFKKLDTDGNLLLEKEINPDPDPDPDLPHQTFSTLIAIDSQGGILIAGKSTENLNTGEDQPDSAGFTQFIMKLNPDGDKIWARHIPGVWNFFIDPLDRIVFLAGTVDNETYFYAQFSQPDLKE